jgi:hypothetical protein
VTEVPSRAPSAARIAGDDYQYLVSWNEALSALLPRSGAQSITVEDPDAASVDDVVIRYTSGLTRYVQVKHAVDASSPVSSEWLMAAKGNQRSVLKKFYDSWQTVAAASSVIEMQLVTDRQLDHGDLVLACYDTKTERLTPLIASDALRPGAVALRDEWAAHVGCDVPELVRMLEALTFRVGRPPAAERERAEHLMQLHGLAHDRSALDSAVALVREWVQERWRQLTVDEVRALVMDRIPTASEPWSLMVIEGIDNVEAETQPVASVRFVERYAGDNPFDRRNLRDPAEWTIINDEIVAAADGLKAEGHQRILVRAAMRLPAWFAAGAALRHVRGFTVAAEQQGQVWASDLAGVAHSIPTAVHPVGGGTDLAVAMCVATDASDSVVAYVEANQLPVSEVVCFGPPLGPGNEAVRNGADAATLAVSLRDAARQALSQSTATRIHLFLATPAALALLLGHRWNALAPTTVYEHVGGSTYSPTVTLSA